jgi:hypothetical protein
MKDLRIHFSIFKKFYFGIYNKFAAETATPAKKFLTVRKNPFLKGYVIEIILPFSGMTKRERIDRKYKRLCNFARYVKKHINRKLGRKMLDFYRDKWSDSYN